MIENKIIIVGPAGSGKNFLANRMVEKNFKMGLLYTSRPRRGQNDNDYHFITDREFDLMNREDRFLTHKSFNNWQYGLTFNEWQNNNLFILAPDNIKDLKKMGHLNNSFVIYINPGVHILHHRLLERSDSNDSIERRMQADIEDFNDFTDYNIKITNTDF